MRREQSHRPPTSRYVSASTCPVRYGVAWAVWRGDPIGVPDHAGFVPGGGEPLYAQLCALAFARALGVPVKWIASSYAEPFAGNEEFWRYARICPPGGGRP